MGKQIIVQPDGRLCVWSTFSDQVTMWNFTDDELVEYFAERAAEDARRHTRETIAQVRAGDRAYYQWTMSFAEAIGQHLGRGAALPAFDVEEELTQQDWPADWSAELIAAVEAEASRWRDDLDEAAAEPAPPRPSTGAWSPPSRRTP